MSEQMRSFSGWNIGSRAAFALAIWPSDIVHRGTIRALMPETGRIRPNAAYQRRHARLDQGVTGSVGSKTAKKLHDFYWRMKRDGTLNVGEYLIQIVDRPALVDYALFDHRDVPIDVLDYVNAAQVVAEELATEEALRMHDLRREELRTIEKLMMQSVSGGRDSRSWRARLESGEFLYLTHAPNHRKPGRPDA